MTDTLKLSLLAAGAILAWEPCASAQDVLGTIGNVKTFKSTRPNDVWIERRGGRREAPRPFLPIYSGDRLHIATGAGICLNLEGHGQCYGPDMDRTVLTGRGRGSYSAKDNAFVIGVRLLLDAPRRGISYFLNAQGPDEKSTLSASQLSPPGIQYLLPGTRQIALIWQGGPATLRVKADERPMEMVPAGNTADATLDLPIGEKAIHVSTGNGALSWDIEFRSGVPQPGWFDETEVQPSDAKRLVRAIWILRCGPPEWRVFALGELSQLATAGDYLAQQFWMAGRSGELTDTVCPAG